MKARKVATRPLVIKPGQPGAPVNLLATAGATRGVVWSPAPGPRLVWVTPDGSATVLLVQLDRHDACRGVVLAGPEWDVRIERGRRIWVAGFVTYARQGFKVYLHLPDCPQAGDTEWNTGWRIGATRAVAWSFDPGRVQPPDVIKGLPGEWCPDCLAGS